MSVRLEMSVENLQHFINFKNNLIISSIYNTVMIITSDNNTKRDDPRTNEYIFF